MNWLVFAYHTFGAHALAALRADVFLSVWYRRLLGEAVLALPSMAALNLHGSLLPAYRGRAPLNWVLVNGETRTGVTLHHMTLEADAGDIVAQEVLDIRADDTALTLYERMVKRVAMQREGQPEDIASAIAFLCSERARYITGAVLTVTGGMDLFTF